ncbi:MAG: type VI secretion system tip protein VgrG [Polyangiaceae bacterium]|nr:type VI secretion system tip protein VgrG [Polyangiaceae bacterium]
MAWAELRSDTLGTTRVVAFRGTEIVSQPYCIDVWFTTREPVELAAAIATSASLVLRRDDASGMTLHGLCASLELLAQTPELVLYHACLRPRLWQLGLTEHSNAFTKKTAPDIIKAVLEASGLGGEDFELRLAGDYPVEELVVQYRESNLAFLERWMEHEGLYYYFEHPEDGSAEKLVIVDAKSAHEPLVDRALPYRPAFGADQSAGECFDSFTVLQSALVGRVNVLDYDYLKPALELSAGADVTARGFGVQNEHGARFFDPTQGSRYAKLRAEELACRETLYHAVGNALGLRSGYTVTLDEHPSDEHNVEYLALEVHHHGNLLGQGEAQLFGRYLEPKYAEVYRVEMTAVTASTQYRAPRATPWPRVWGYENGIVDGEAESEYAQIDDAGRYLVKFGFDESEPGAGKASTFVRMKQPHGGTTEGFHFPLRKGTEVVFTFLGGDPDRPVIAGVVPNAEKPSPITAANHTKNMIRTGGGNHLTIDDNQGAEFIHLFTPKLTELFMGGPTCDEDGETQRHQLGAPPEGQATACTTQDVSTSFYLYTDMNAGFLVDTEWWQSVSGDIHIYGGGKLLEQYAGPHVWNVAGNSAKWYGAFLAVDVASNEDRHVVGWWNLKADAGATMRSPHIHGFASTDVLMTADSEMKLKAPHGEIGFDSDAYVHCGTTTLKFGATSVDWAATTGTIASVEVTIPGGAKITTPKWEVADPNETWVGAISEWKLAKKAEFIGLKIEGVGIAIGAVGAKVETVGAKAENNAAHLKKIVGQFRTGGFKAGMKAVWSAVAGMTAIA